MEATPACALDPLLSSNNSLFNELVARDRSALDHLRVEDGTFFGMAALRARVLAIHHDYTEAFDLLEATLFHQPTRPFLPWARGWPIPARDLIQFGEAYLQVVSEQAETAQGVLVNLTTLGEMLSTATCGSSRRFCPYRSPSVPTSTAMVG